MNDLDKLLNEPQVPQLKEKPTAAANKAAILIAQEKAIADASVGSRVFKSAKDFLANNIEVTGYKKEFVSAPVASRK